MFKAQSMCALFCVFCESCVVVMHVSVCFVVDVFCHCQQD